LLLAQELLEEPKMSNHARGLWGYSGTTATGERLTIQATGMGGPSATLVLVDLVELGLRRALRVGTCIGFDDSCELGELLWVRAAVAAGASATALGVAAGETLSAAGELSERLQMLGEEGRPATIASFDTHPPGQPPQARVIAADMQTAPLLAQARRLEVEFAAILIVATGPNGESLGKDRLEAAEKRAGRIAHATLSG
jgi:uridine phosphorylase